MARPQSGNFEGGARNAGRRNARKRERLLDAPLQPDMLVRDARPPMTSGESPARNSAPASSTKPETNLNRSGLELEPRRREQPDPVENHLRGPAGLSGGRQHRREGKQPAERTAARQCTAYCPTQRAGCANNLNDEIRLNNATACRTGERSTTGTVLRSAATKRPFPQARSSSAQDPKGFRRIHLLSLDPLLRRAAPPKPQESCFSPPLCAEA